MHGRAARSVRFPTGSRCVAEGACERDISGKCGAATQVRKTSTLCLVNGFQYPVHHVPNKAGFETIDKYKAIAAADTYH